MGGGLVAALHYKTLGVQLYELTDTCLRYTNELHACLLWQAKAVSKTPTFSCFARFNTKKPTFCVVLVRPKKNCTPSILGHLAGLSGDFRDPPQSLLRWSELVDAGFHSLWSAALGTALLLHTWCFVKALLPPVFTWWHFARRDHGKMTTSRCASWTRTPHKPKKGAF